MEIKPKRIEGMRFSSVLFSCPFSKTKKLERVYWSKAKKQNEDRVYFA